MAVCIFNLDGERIFVGSNAANGPARSSFHFDHQEAFGQYSGWRNDGFPQMGRAAACSDPGQFRAEAGAFAGHDVASRALVPGIETGAVEGVSNNRLRDDFTEAAHVNDKVSNIGLSEKPTAWHLWFQSIFDELL